MSAPSLGAKQQQSVRSLSPQNRLFSLASPGTWCHCGHRRCTAVAITRSRGGWMICERVPPTRSGRRVRKWVPTLVEAAKLLEEPADQPAQAADLGPTLKDFSVEFLKRHGPARNDPRTYGSNVRILLEHFGNEVRMGAVTVPMVLDFRIARIEKDK